MRVTPPTDVANQPNFVIVRHGNKVFMTRDTNIRLSWPGHKVIQQMRNFNYLKGVLLSMSVKGKGVIT